MQHIALVDHSDVAIWIFMGFCALIVIAQIVPAILLVFGITKGIKEINKKNK